VGVAAGQRLKYEQYFDGWEKDGFQITVSSFMDKRLWDIVYQKGYFFSKILGTIRGYLRRYRDLFRVGSYDTIYVFMWVTPLGSSLFERLFQFLSKRLIYDIEDNVFQGAGNSINPFMKFIKSPSKTTFLIKNADHVITSTPDLNDYCLTLNLKKQCTYISSSINTDRFIPTNKYSNSEIVTVGWTGTFSSKAYLDILSDVFVDLSKHCDFKLLVIGNFEYELPGVDLEVIQWSSEREVEDLQRIDIGVYPLPFNDWVSGKSGLKAIQYMAFGLPTVATEVGHTPKIITDNVNGLLVKTLEDWSYALDTLLKSPSLRRQLGEEARISVLANYSTHVIASNYLTILNSSSKDMS
jgi:glycosyltransferase involved in cell wall biosynthesis